MLPNFVIAGAPRSGTTSLYYYLKQHPEISFPDLKEPRYFSSINLKLPQKGPGDDTVDEKLILTFEDYCNLYKGIENKKVGDASSAYLYHHDISALEMFNKLGDIPVLIMLRNPTTRAYSAYSNLVRDGREFLSFEDGVNKENYRKSENWDMMWAYIDVSLYHEQVKTYKDVFTNVKVLIFEEFVKNPKENLKDIFSFFEIDKDFTPETSNVYSHSGAPANKFIGWLTSRQNKFIYPFRKFLLENIKRSYLEKISKVIFKKSKSKTTIKLNKNLTKQIEIDILRLEKLLDKNLDCWK